MFLMCISFVYRNLRVFWNYEHIFGETTNTCFNISVLRAESTLWQEYLWYLNLRNSSKRSGWDRTQLGWRNPRGSICIPCHWHSVDSENDPRKRILQSGKPNKTSISRKSRSEKLGPSFFEVFKISETTIFVRECLRLIRTLDFEHFRSIAIKKVFRPHPTTFSIKKNDNSMFCWSDSLWYFHCFYLYFYF